MAGGCLENKDLKVASGNSGIAPVSGDAWELRVGRVDTPAVRSLHFIYEVLNLC